MKTLDEVLEKLPENIRLPIYEAINIAIEEGKRHIVKEDISKVWEAIKDLTEAQRRTEENIKELVEAQKRTEERLGKLEEKMAELAEAQKKTEQRVNELAEAQKRTEERLGKLEEKMAELAEAQKKTEQRVNELVEAQKRTEEKLGKLEEEMAALAKAQRKTEERLEKLIGVVDNLQDEVGGISHSVGHILEDKAIVKLPKILKENYGIEVEGKLKRGFLENKRGEVEEINIFGFGKRNGDKIFIIGEGKARFGRKDLKHFQKKIERFKDIYGEPFPIIVTYIFSKPEVEKKVKELKIAYFLSYELEG